MKQTLYTLAILIFFSVAVKAQYNLGVATGNWSGTQALYLNPASIADSRERFTIDIFSANAGLDNNLGTLNTSGGIFDLINKGTTQNVFQYSNNNQFSLVAPYANIHLPGCMISINHKHSIALTTGIRGMNQFNNFDRSLYRTLTDPTYLPNGNLDLTSNKFNYTAHVWSEVGLSYAGVILDEFQHELKVGVTLRYLGGIGYIGLKGNNLDAHYKSGNNDTLVVTHSDLEFASNILSTRNAVLNGVSNHNILDEFFGSKDGAGIGADVGVIYEYTPNPTEHAHYNEPNKGERNHARNRYLLRFSASVMDIGAITYYSSHNSNANVTGNGTVAGQDFSNNVHNYNDFRNYAVSHGFTADTAHKDTKVYMPTTLNLAADYHAYKRLYVNATFIANLANRQNFGTSYYNQITVTPRYDSKLFSVGLPLTYGFLSNAVKAGIGFRISGFFVGSDDMLALFTSGQSGFNLYFGGFIPFNRHSSRDRYYTPESDTTDMRPEPDSEHGGSNDSTDNGTTMLYHFNSNTTSQTAYRQAGYGIDNDIPANRNKYMRGEIEKKD